MEDSQIDLPPIWRETTPPNRRVMTPTKKRRRRSRDYDSGNSSDVPFFSSDDLADATLENYDTPKAKRVQKRAWYEHEKQATFASVDSGVFVNSDSGSEDGFGLEFQSSPIMPAKVPKLTLPSNNFRIRPPLTRQPTVQTIIFQCLEQGHQIVDLSQRSLTALSSAALKPLHQLILPPRSSQTSSHDNDSFYHPLKPALELYLSQNILRTIPGEIMRLNNLTVLSLRHNKLTELPSSFSRLQNLCELNVSSNLLTTLPWELLHIIGPNRKLRTFTIHPNPMAQAYRTEMIDESWAEEHLRRMKDSDLSVPVQKEFAALRIAFEEGKKDGSLQISDDEVLYRSWILKVVEELCQRWNAQQEPSQIGFLAATPVEPSPIILGTSKISWLGIDGQPIKESLNMEPPDFTKPVIPASDASCPPLAENSCSRSAVPSLFELALRECAFSPDLPELEKWLPSEAPPLVRKAIVDTDAAVDEGGKQCSYCKSRFIIPRAQWIEYWFWKPNTRSDSVDHEPTDFAIPFRRQVCSWRCAQPGRNMPEHIRFWAKRKPLFQYLHGWHDGATAPKISLPLKKSDFLDDV